MVTNNSKTAISYLITPSSSKEYTIRSDLADSMDLQSTFTSMNAILFFFLSTLITLDYLISRMQVEKCSKMRNFMRMMGMSDTFYYMSYFIFHALSSLLLSLLITAIARLLLFPGTNIVLIFIQTYLMLLNVFFFALLIK